VLLLAFGPDAPPISSSTSANRGKANLGALREVQSTLVRSGYERPLVRILDAIL
jgi:hypothetical protein